MKVALRFVFAFFLVSIFAKPALPQNTNTGEIRGVVTDPSGAVVPGASVTLININTGETKAFVTNEDGIYDTVATPTGTYNIGFSREGFKKLVRGPIVLQVEVITENATLQVGAAQQEVRVTAAAPLLETETGEQATTLEARTMNELPQQGAGITGNDWANFNILLPGASSAPSQPQSEGSGAYNAGDAVSLNGNLPNYANFLQDGATTQLPVSNNNDNEIFETIQEVKITTSSFSAQYGLGGAVFNQISKGGTNGFHGSAYEYWQNDILDASSYFSHQRSYLRYDEWGGSIGGPIIKNKLFFYFDRDKIYDFSGANQGYATVPTAAMKTGDFTGLPPIYDPTTAGVGGTRTQFASNMITTIDPVAQKLLSYWPLPNAQGIAHETCVAGYPNDCSNNYFYVQSAPNPNLRYFGRIDYDLSQANRVSFSISQKDNPGFNKNALPCPLNCYSGDIDGYNAQISDTWTISPRMVNEFRMGYTKQGNWFVPQTNGFNPLTTLGLQYAKANIFPNISPNTFTGLAAGTYAIYIENLYDPSDIVTLIKGKHILHFGVEVLMGQGNTTPWGAVNAGSFTFTGNYTAQNGGSGLSGSSFADFLLGDVQSWSANNQGLTGARLKSPQLFVQDDIKLRPNLTVNLGLRYVATTGFSEVFNRAGGFDPNLINPVNGPYCATYNLGCAGTLGSMWFAGQDNRTNLQKPIYNIFLPRVGFAWSPRNDTTIRGGFGMYSYNFSMDDYGNGMGFGSNSSGSASDINNGAGPAPLIYLDSSAATAAAKLPYVAASTNPAAYITNPPSGETYVPYDVPVGRINEWSLAVEHQFAQNFLASIAYVGSHSMDLQFPTNLNQITNPSQLSATDTNPAFGDFRPYPNFGGLGGNNYDAIANYHSLQTQITKRYANGLTFNVNYVWSHFLDEQDSAGWGNRGGNQSWQIGNNPRLNYGNSNFDIRHAVKGYVSYDLPFGKGGMYLNNSNAMDDVVGGWRISGTFLTQSGNPFTVYDSNNNSYSQAGTWYLNTVSGVDPHISNPNLSKWFNTAAFVAPAKGTFGDAGRNTLVGPRLTVVDMSLAKSFRLTERIQLQLRGDFINALNHPSFSPPNNDINNAAFGTINSTTVAPRSGQLSAHLSF